MTPDQAPPDDPPRLRASDLDARANQLLDELSRLRALDTRTPTEMGAKNAEYRKL